MLKIWGAALAALGLLATPASAQPADAERFVAPAVYHDAALSPDGKYLAIVQRTNDGDLLVLTDLATRHTRALQHMTERMQGKNGGFDWIAWKGNDRLIVGATLDPLYGYTIRRVFAMDRDGTGLVQMFENRLGRIGDASTYLLDDLRNDPQHVLMVSSNEFGLGVWRADVTTGRVERVVAEVPDIAAYITDGEGNPVMREESLRDGSGYRVFRRAAGSEEWTFVLEARRAATATNSPDFQMLAPGPGANQVYIFARPDDRDLGALYLYNTATGEMGAPLQEGVSADVASPWILKTGELFATCEEAERLVCRARDPEVQRHFNAIDRFFQHNQVVMPVSMSDDESMWLLHAVGPTEPGAYYLYDRQHATVDLMATAHPELDPSVLSPTNVVHYQSRDGADLWAYVTVHAGAPGPRPMVVMPHGGPEARDDYGFDPLAQFLASRGYMVVQPNFRGSSGFGRAFADAGRGQWGKRMQDDVTDAVQHMIDTGAADPHRICIVGGSYGGYAALAGATLTPDLYRCAVSISGISDLIESLRVDREHGTQTTYYQYWMRSMGDPRTDRDALIAASPRMQAARVHIPVLLVHGDLDGIVDVHQSELMRDALNGAGHPARFIRVRMEGHSFYFWKQENRLMLFQEIESFLAQNMNAP